MKLLKTIMLRLLGARQYLKWVSHGFFVAFAKGWLRNNPAYYTHYVALDLIAPGHTILDIGANLGYYSVHFAKATGRSGKVWAVEPIALYRSVLQHNLRKLSNVEVLPYALGETEGTLRMGNPSAQQHRHGLMRVLAAGEEAPNSYIVPVKNPQALFSSLVTRVDYIKCDIEGYEVPVLPAMLPLLQQQRPIVQVETEGENKHTLLQMFLPMGYQAFFAVRDGLQPYPHPEAPLPGDLILIPDEKLNKLQHLIVK